MSIAAQYIPAAYSLTAVGVWGTSDFLGGVGVRRANAFLFTAIVHLSGMVMMGALALTIVAPFPGHASLIWSLTAGSFAGIALALFYRSLASGNMGLIAPVAAVLGAAIPTIVTAFGEGFPKLPARVGFVLAIIGVWLISRSEAGVGRPEGAGHGCAGRDRLCWFLSLYPPGGYCFRAVDFHLFALLFLPGDGCDCAVRKTLALGSGPGARHCSGRGILDITGSAVFVRASQIGRLDDAVVLSSLYPAVTVLLARIFLHEHFSRSRTAGMVAALVAVPMIAG